MWHYFTVSAICISLTSGVQYFRIHLQQWYTYFYVSNFNNILMLLSNQSEQNMSTFWEFKDFSLSRIWKMTNSSFYFITKEGKMYSYIYLYNSMLYTIFVDKGYKRIAQYNWKTVDLHWWGYTSKWYKHL